MDIIFIFDSHVVALSELHWKIVSLTHWGQDKMAAEFPDVIFKCIFLNV